MPCEEKAGKFDVKGASVGSVRTSRFIFPVPLLATLADELS